MRQKNKIGGTHSNNGTANKITLKRISRLAFMTVSIKLLQVFHHFHLQAGLRRLGGTRATRVSDIGRHAPRPYWML